GELDLVDGLVGEVSGRFLPTTVLVRRLVARGRCVRATLQFVPRFGYDRRPPARVGRRAGALVCEGGSLAVAIASDGPPVATDRPVDIEVCPGSPITIVLTAARRTALIVVPPGVAITDLDRDERG